MSSQPALHDRRYSPDVTVRLADGRFWSFPAPGTPGDLTRPCGLEYERLVQLLFEASDDTERRIAELCLSIFLLSWNYDLSPVEFAAALEFTESDELTTEAGVALTNLVRWHVDAWRTRFEGPSADVPADEQIKDKQVLTGHLYLVSSTFGPSSKSSP